MADGYARASGKVGVAIATSGPGATNMVTGIATAMMDSSPIVCITGQVGSKLIGIRRVPGDRHHRHHAADHQAQLPGDARRGRRAGGPRGVRDRASPAGPGPVLIDITKDAQQASCEFDWDARRAAAARLPSGPPRRRSATARGALELINDAEAAGDPRRPRHHAVGRRRDRCVAFAERAQIPIAMTLLGIGGVPASPSAEPRHDGHARRGLGQHTRSRKPTCCSRSACASTTASPATSRPTRRTRKKIHIEIDPAEINKNVQVDVGARRRPARGARDAAAAASRRGDRTRVAARTSTSSRATPRSATSRTCPTTGTSTPRT